MTPRHRPLAWTAVSLAALIAATSSAHAGAFGIREQSATAQGLSFAGAASGSGGLSSTFWNPATVTMKPGWNVESSFSAIIPDAEIHPLPGTSPLLLPLGGSGNIGLEAVVPASYGSYQLSDSLWVGVSATSAFALASKPNPVWAGQVYSRTAKVVSINLNPIIGIKVNEWLSLAAGPTVQYFDLTSKRAAGFSPNSQTVIVEGDDIGIGFTAGVNLTPFAGTNIGVGFRSSIHHELEGELRNPTPTPVSLPIGAKVNTPEMVTVGLSQQITPALTFHAGFEWTNWSRLKTPVIVGPGVTAAFPLNYEDGYFYSAGLEYQILPQWVVRAGLAYEDSPITQETRNPRLPDNDRVWLSLGVGYQWSQKLSFDVAYSHVFVRNARISITPGHQDYIANPFLPGGGLPLLADADTKLDIISASVKYRWDDPKVAIAAVPIVRKY